MLMQNGTGTKGEALEVEITTRNGSEYFQVDMADWPVIEQVQRWYLYKDPKGRKMARAGKEDDQVLLHRYLFEIPKGSRLEWINEDTLDCRRENLQLVDKDGNITPLKQPEAKKTSDVRGVYFHKAARRWHASAFWEGKRYSLGYFEEEQDAISEIEIFRAEGPESKNIKRNHRKGVKK
jgi:hypothetical protein